MNEFMDPMTGLNLSFDEDTIFKVLISSRNSAKYVHKVFSHSQIEDCLKEYHALIIGKNQHKYLFMNQVTKPIHGHGKLIYRSKGYAVNGYRAVRGRRKTDYIAAKSTSLKGMPQALHYKLKEYEYKSLPLADSAWNFTKVVFVVLSHFVELPKEEANKFISKALKDYYALKLASGGSKDITKDMLELKPYEKVSNEFETLKQELNEAIEGTDLL